MTDQRKHLIFEISIQVLIFVFIFSYLPPHLIFGNGPATGGDTGSHFWTLHFLKDLAWDQGHFDLRFWNPGNYFGEPLLVHYFPLPFIMMGLLSYIIGTANAFNFITIFGCLTLPLSIYLSCKVLKVKGIYPTLASIIPLLFLFDESWSIYGGNISSTLAGQFAHSISLNLFFLGMAFTISDLNKNKIPLYGIFFFFLVAISHAYTFIATPLFFLIYLLMNPSKDNLKKLTFSGIFILLLSAWFLIPMVDNQSYHTYYAFKSTWWYIGRIIKSYYLLIPLSLGIIPMLYLCTKNRFKHTALFQWFLSLFVLSLIYAALYFIFPYIGLVDGRAVPHTYLYLFICVGISFAFIIENFFKSQKVRYVATIIILFITCFSIFKYSKTIPLWVKWNYDGWYKKPLTKELKGITGYLQADFSQPRVAYENAAITNSAGTIRAFEMLPYFSSRATTEGVYNQSTIVNNAAFELQGMISSTPSCPFHERFPCSAVTFKNIQDKMHVLGADRLIITSKRVLEKAKKSKDVQFLKKFGPWHLYKTVTDTSLVEVVKTTLVKSSRDWRNDFYTWFKNYQDGKPFLVHYQDSKLNPKTKLLLSEHNKASGVSQACSPQVKVKYGGFKLLTNCPNQAHILKFSYHSAWSNSSNSPMMLISPGFILTFPKTTGTEFRFGKTTLWTIANLISLVSFLIFGFFLYLRYNRDDAPN